MQNIKIYVNGNQAIVPEGISVAAALLNNGISQFRDNVTGGEKRAPLCGMGICYECRCTINGTLHQRSCMTICEDGMEIQT